MKARFFAKAAGVLTALALTAALTGCALMPQTAASPSPAPPSSAGSPSPSVPQESVSSTAPLQTEAPGPESEAPASPSPAPSAAFTSGAESSGGGSEVAMLYDRFTAYADFEAFWYQGGNAQAATSEVIEHEGREYCRYETPEVKTFADFTAAALLLMTQEQFDLLQSRVTYIDYQGGLYGPHSYGAGDRSGFAGYECEAVGLSEQEYELKAGHYYYATALDSGADPEKRVLVGETTCRFFLSEGRWKVSSAEYEAAGSAVG